ncbi:MAG: hypothetical protein JXA41_03645 [Deltaproteobacteria bacterium]|nr:hypothetical protein [Deltaproteobacteria bacterium]
MSTLNIEKALFYVKQLIYFIRSVKISQPEMQNTVISEATEALFASVTANVRPDLITGYLFVCPAHPYLICCFSVSHINAVD